MTESHPLDESSKAVFTKLRARKAMPLLEIAAVTGIRGDALHSAVKDLEDKKLVEVKGADPLNTIVSVSGKYY